MAGRVAEGLPQGSSMVPTMRLSLVLTSVVVLGLFGLSCWLPAGYWRGPFVEEGIEPDGWWLVLFGWRALPLLGVTGLAWFANPLLGAGLACLWGRCRGAAAALAGVAVVLS